MMVADKHKDSAKRIYEQYIKPDVSINILVNGILRCTVEQPLYQSTWNTDTFIYTCCSSQGVLQPLCVYTGVMMEFNTSCSVNC